MPLYLDATQLGSALLSVLKKDDAWGEQEHTFVVHEVHHHHHHKHDQHHGGGEDGLSGHGTSDVHRHRTQRIASGWVGIDIRDIVTGWYDSKTTVYSGTSNNHTLQITCKTCRRPNPIVMGPRDAPFIKLDTAGGGGRGRRMRRAAPMTRFSEGRRIACDSSRQCCTKRLSVNLTDSEDYPWLLRPKVFDIDYCDGSCAIIDHICKSHRNIAL